MPRTSKGPSVWELGKYIGPGRPTHGNASTYRSATYRCRCRECTDANTVKVRSERYRRQALLAEDPDLVEHGKATTYRNWGCRCESCSEAHSQMCKDYQSRRKAHGGGPLQEVAQS